MIGGVRCLLKMESLAAILEGEFITKMANDDENYVSEVMEGLDGRRVSLIARMQQRSRDAVERLQERFWNKAEEAIKHRRMELSRKKAELEMKRAMAVDTYRRYLRGESMKHLEMLKFTNETDAAHLLESIKEHNERKVAIYEDDLQKAHNLQYYKAEASAVNTSEMKGYLDKCIESFRLADEEQVLNFARTVGDSDSQLQSIIEKWDALFRSRVAVMLRHGEEVEELIIEHRRVRDVMVEEHKICDYEDIVNRSDTMSSTLIRDLDESCVGCFGVDKISKDYFELCPEAH